MSDERAAAGNPGSTDAVQPCVSVIIPHLNTQESLMRCLQSVADQQLDHGVAEVIVVDNGSSLPLDAVVAAFPVVRVLAEPAPGPGLARNRGVAAARAPVLAFIDADCRAAPGWLQAALTAVAADPARAIFGGDIRIDFASPGHLTGIEAYEAVFGFRQRMYIETKHFSVTANLAMGRAVHAAIGPFAGVDTAEDLDWGQRAHAAGFVTRYLPDMRVYHPARADFAGLARKWQRHVRHDWNAHVAAGRPAWRWRARAAALLASVPVECLRMFVSDRVSGLANRLRGIGVLARIRAFRAAEMLRVMSAPAESGTSFWNQQP
jgi:glycosyltransferase involved in cell wall biosynthesis